MSNVGFAGMDHALFVTRGLGLTLDSCTFENHRDAVVLFSSRLLTRGTLKVTNMDGWALSVQQASFGSVLGPVEATNAGLFVVGSGSDLFVDGASTSTQPRNTAVLVHGGSGANIRASLSITASPGETWAVISTASSQLLLGGDVTITNGRNGLLASNQGRIIFNGVPAPPPMGKSLRITRNDSATVGTHVHAVHGGQVFLYLGNGSQLSLLNAAYALLAQYTGSIFISRLPGTTGSAVQASGTIAASRHSTIGGTMLQPGDVDEDCSDDSVCE